MKNENFSLKADTTGAPEFIDITDWVKGCVGKPRVSNGFVVVYSRHSTAAVLINENEPLLIEDMARFLEAACPRRAAHRHKEFSARTVN